MNHYKRWVIYTAAAFLLISATLVNTPNLYFMATLLLALPLISYGLGMLALRDLEFDREVPPSGWEGEVATFHVLVHSHSRIPKLFLQATDPLPADLVVLDDELLFNAAANTTTRIPYRVEMAKRGAYTLEGLHVIAQDPLGIYSFRRTYPVVSQVLVYPTPQEIPAFSLSGAERFGFQELPIAATKGSGVDPDGVRQYVPGDPLRRMHWKSTARTGKLNVIEFEESHAVNVVMALDQSADSVVGEGRQSTFEYLVTAAASIAQMAIRQGASVRLVAGDSPDPADFAGRGSEHLFMILSSLARAEANLSTSIGDNLVERVGVIPPGTTLIVLTARADGSLPGAIAHYTAAGVQTHVFYADPASFPQRRRNDEERSEQFVSEVTGAQAAVFILRHNEERRIQPEILQNAFTSH